VLGYPQNILFYVTQSLVLSDKSMLTCHSVAWWYKKAVNLDILDNMVTLSLPLRKVGIFSVE